MNKKILILLIGLLGITGLINGPVKDGVVGFATTRGFSTLPTSQGPQTQVSYEFGVVDIPLERPGAASSSTGFEFGHLLVTNTTAVTVSSASTGFAVTMQESGRIRGCAFSLQTIPTTGSVSVMIQKNGTLQTTAYCRLPSTSTFATNGGIDDVSVNQSITPTDITFVAGDRLGLIASSSNLNAATFDGNAKLIVEINP